MQFAIDVALMIQKLPKSTINATYLNQLIRCSCSPGANYRAACRAKSTPDFINELKIVEEELDESMYFLELLNYFNPDLRAEIDMLSNEANQLLAITVSSIKTTRKNS